MNKSPNRSKPNAFDPNQYQRPGLSNSEICDMKEIFDVFDF